MSNRCPNCGIINNPRAKSCSYCHYDFATGTLPPSKAQETQPAPTQQTGSTDSEKALGSERTTSGAAVLALITGIASVGIGSLILLISSFSINLKGNETFGLICGVVSLVFCLVMSFIGLREIRRSEGKLRGWKAAIGGLSIGVLGVALYAGIAILGIQDMQDKTNREASAKNLKGPDKT